MSLSEFWKTGFPLWHIDMPELSLVPARIKSSATDQLCMNIPGKTHFKYLHFEIPKFSWKAVSEAKKCALDCEAFN